MSEIRIEQHNKLPEQISIEVDRERRRGASTHPWYGRLPTITSRVATYLALTEESDSEFLSKLGSINPGDDVINEARLRVRDAAWQWKWREFLSSSETNSDIPSPDIPKILDPFAGSGSIPLEASRLGCEAYAVDLNPIAYLLLRAVLEFPIAFIAHDNSVQGSSPDGKWNGLVEELIYWANKVDHAVSHKVKTLFPTDLENQPSHYIWIDKIQCPECSAVFPISKTVPLSTRPPLSLTYNWSSQEPIPFLTSDKYTPYRGSSECPECGNSVNYKEIGFKQDFDPFLAGIRQSKLFFVASPELVPKLYPWLPEQQQRLEELVNKPFASALHQLLPENNNSKLIRGYETFQDLLSPRQLLVSLEYIVSIREVIQEMGKKDIPIERIHALTTYLALFIGFFVDRNNKLCQWNAGSGIAMPMFSAPSQSIPIAYVEMPPFGMMTSWLEKIIPAIHATANYRQKGKVYHGDAAQLSFEDNYFDSIITAPPYYDCIQYSKNFDFLWIWESMVISALQSDYGVVKICKDAYVESQNRQDANSYEQKLLKVTQEIYRVLKPGHRLCIFFANKDYQVFQDYVDFFQKVGFELLNIRYLSETPNLTETLTSKFTYQTYLLYFRKPLEFSPRQSLKATGIETLLNSATEGKPVLYEAFAKFLMDELDHYDVMKLLPQGGKGNTLEQLMEAIAEKDPKKLLLDHLGTTGLRKIAKNFSEDSKENLSSPTDSPTDLILSSFGFVIPPLSDKIEGPEEVRKILYKLTKEIQSATDSRHVKSSFKEGCHSIEQLLKVAIWGWTQRLFGSERDSNLLAIIHQKDPKKKLDLLSFGDIVDIFRKLPSHIKDSEQCDLIKAKFNREDIYLPKKFSKPLDKISEFRNKVEHKRYCEDTPLNEQKEVLSKILEEANELIKNLVESKAIPRIAEPYREIRDKWNRRRYELLLDDDTQIEIGVSEFLVLGETYLYFGTETNPRPVDPLVLPIHELGKIP